MKKILIAGASGMVGRSLCQYFKNVGIQVIAVSRNIDLTIPNCLWQFLREKPDWCIISAGKVGGIKANSENPLDFYNINARIAMECLSTLSGTNIKTLYLGSSCLYPKYCLQPMQPENILSGAIEKTNEGYGLAKAIGVRLCEYYREQKNDDFISCIPASLYGPHDNFFSDDSHVMPALIRKFSTEKAITLWGTGEPVREFLHVDDFAAACHVLLKNYSNKTPINVGNQQGTKLKDLVEIIIKKTNFQGQFKWDNSKPDGMPFKVMDSTVIHNMGWSPEINLEKGIEETLLWTQQNKWCLERKYEQA
jgi:GDP-L-fucose synthase